jgi:hypothetical protein
MRPIFTGARPTTWTNLPLLLAVSLPLLAGTARAADPAQPAPCPPGSQDVDCKAPPRSATPPDQQPKAEGQGSGSTTADPDLSDRLSESRGILAPPPTGDTEIQRPVPSAGAGKTPVIPPPGSPGGDPTVVPK